MQSKLAVVCGVKQSLLKQHCLVEERLTVSVTEKQQKQSNGCLIRMQT